MSSNTPCTICGSKDVALIDGFYYCVECGTQDATARETVIEKSIFADGTTAFGTRKKVVKIGNDKVEMTGEWYKWHTYNFILCGLADELIELGAKPTFKMKLLWIWSKYIEKYHSEQDFQSETINNLTKSHIVDKNKTIDNSEDETEDRPNANNSCANYISRRRDIRTITCALLVSMVYTALNIDKCDLQMSHLFRYIQEGRIDISNFDRHMPEDINIKSIPGWPQFVGSCSPRRQLSPIKCRWLSIALLNQLGIGPPVLPNIRNITNNFIVELCLPQEFKNLVFSLMYSFPIKLQIDDCDLAKASKTPDYEAAVMAYVVVALKICFGLDDDYEYTLSKAVDKINEKENASKFYKLGFASDTTGRLFPFKDWIQYLKFRRKMLSIHCMIDTEDEHYLDKDDYIYVEYLPDRPTNKIDLTDELSINIINKIPHNKDLNIIPKSNFECSLTPFCTYTEVIANHSTDNDLVMLLSEEFSRYSLSYACEALELIDPETSSNLITGINKNNKEVMNCEAVLYEKKPKHKQDTEMVIVRNCDNKNWFKTNKPTLKHIVEDDNEFSNEKESDHGYDSNGNSSDKDTTTLVENEIENNKFETIIEEDEDKNIFDDDFLIYEIKTEPEDPEVEDLENQQEQNDIFEDDFDDRDEGPDDSKSVHSVDSFEFNPDTFNRARAIKELILKACKTHKIPIPKEYRSTEPRKRKSEFSNNETSEPKRRCTQKRGEAKIEINKLLEAYYSQMERDVVSKVAQDVRNTIWNMEKSIQEARMADDKSHVSLVTDTPAASFVEDNQNIEEHIEPQNITSNNENALEDTALQESQIEMTEEIEQLFDEDSDVDVDELIPKTDPKFDENEYDISQLYIKMGKIETEDVYDTIKDEQLTKIIDKNIEDFKAGLITKKPKEVIEKRDSDSEEDVPLSTIKDAKLKEPLIKSNIPQKFKYWFRHYVSQFIIKSDNRKEIFDSDLTKNTPRTFSYLLNECALISGTTPFRIYKYLYSIEKRILKATKRKS